MSEVRKPPVALAAPALPRENYKPIKECRTLDELFVSADFRERIVSSVPRHMTNDRVLSVVLRAHMTSPLLLQATPQSFAGACLTATNTGLEPNSALQEAHLIPFKTTIRGRDGNADREVMQIQVIFGYSGLLKLASNTGRLLSISANVVYPDADIFDWMEGSETYLKFKRGGRRDRRDDDQPGYAYFHARLTGGGESMEVWPYSDVLRVRNMSQAYRRAKAMHDKDVAAGKRPGPGWTMAPWVAHEQPMSRKTMIRAGIKYIPKSVELANAVRVDEATDRRDIDYSRVIDMAGNSAEPDYSGAAAMLGELGGADDGGMDDGAEYQPRTAGSDAAFGDRRTVDTGTTQPKPKPETERQQAPPPPAFEHYLISEAGEYEGPFVDPVQFAKAFVDHYRGVARSDIATYLENNEAALEEARRAPIADQMLSVTDPATAPTLLVVALGKGGRENWPDYVHRFHTVLFGRSDVDEWLTVQQPNMSRAPMAVRLSLIKHVRERCEQLRLQPPEWVGMLASDAKPKASDAPSDATPSDATAKASDAPSDAPVDMAGKPSPAAPAGSDERWAGDTIAYVKTLAMEAAVNEFAGSAAVQAVMRRLRREAPMLFDQVDNAIAIKLADFAGASQ